MGGEHKQMIVEGRPPLPERMCLSGLDPRIVELPPPVPWHREKRKMAYYAMRTPNTFMRAEEVKYRTSSKARASILRHGGEYDPNENKDWYSMSELLGGRFVTKDDGLVLFFADAGKIEQQGRSVVWSEDGGCASKKHRSWWNYDHGWEQPSTPSGSWQWSESWNRWRSIVAGWNGTKTEEKCSEARRKLSFAYTCDHTSV